MRNNEFVTVITVGKMYSEQTQKNVKVSSFKQTWELAIERDEDDVVCTYHLCFVDRKQVTKRIQGCMFSYSRLF